MGVLKLALTQIQTCKTHPIGCGDKANRAPHIFERAAQALS